MVGPPGRAWAGHGEWAGAVASAHCRVALGSGQNDSRQIQLQDGPRGGCWPQAWPGVPKQRGRQRDGASSLLSPSHGTSRNRPDATQPGLPKAGGGGIWARGSGRCHPHLSHSRPQLPFCTTRTVLPREAGVSTEAVPGSQALPSVSPIESGPVQGSCGQRAPSNQEGGWSAAHLGPPGKGPGTRAGQAATPHPQSKAQASSFVVCFEGRTRHSQTGNSAPHRWPGLGHGQEPRTAPEGQVPVLPGTALQSRGPAPAATLGRSPGRRALHELKSPPNKLLGPKP